MYTMKNKLINNKDPFLLQTELTGKSPLCA